MISRGRQEVSVLVEEKLYFAYFYWTFHGKVAGGVLEINNHLTEAKLSLVTTATQKVSFEVKGKARLGKRFIFIDFEDWEMEYKSSVYIFCNMDEISQVETAPAHYMTTRIYDTGTASGRAVLKRCQNEKEALEEAINAIGCDETIRTFLEGSQVSIKGASGSNLHFLNLYHN